MDIAVVILNWNGLELLKEFLPSVVTHSGSAKIYLADNASTDSSVAFVQQNYPRVTIIRNRTNAGYAKGYNDALKALTEEVLILLNNDVAVTQNWIDPLYKAFKSDSGLVAAQPKILDYKNPEFFEYAGAAGGFIDRYGYPYCRGRLFDTLEKDYGQYDDSRKIFWASGAALAVRNSAFNAVGGFDEDLFAHQEEIDLCWRLQVQSGEVWYIGASEVFHLGGGTLDTSNPQKTFYNFRNSLLVLLKNVKGPRIWGIILMRMLLDGMAAFRFLFKGHLTHFWVVIKAHFHFYYMLPAYLQKRKKNASTLHYYQCKSIVFQYFVRKKRHFSDC